MPRPPPGAGAWCRRWTTSAQGACPGATSPVPRCCTDLRAPARRYTPARWRPGCPARRDVRVHMTLHRWRRRPGRDRPQLERGLRRGPCVRTGRGSRRAVRRRNRLLPSRSALDPDRASWWRPVVNQVLTLVDGATSDLERIVLLAATNDSRAVDPVLLRAVGLGRPSRCCHRRSATAPGWSDTTSAGPRARFRPRSLPRSCAPSREPPRPGPRHGPRKRRGRRRPQAAPSPWETSRRSPCPPMIALTPSAVVSAPTREATRWRLITWRPPA